MENINLTPFKFVLHTKTASDTYFLVNVLGNIAFFIPLGIMTPMLFCGNSFILSVGGGALFSLIIELMQLPILRATDIDDIILNTTGAVIGYVIYLIISKRFPKIKSMFKIK
ncbi:MAG: VanZ family protein [Eubacteriaceae bacterium]|nr:VanZ family protein [Eubacteriaceae bacterium]